MQKEPAGRPALKNGSFAATIGAESAWDLLLAIN
jgi:hypothetical protein